MTIAQKLFLDHTTLAHVVQLNFASVKSIWSMEIHAWINKNRPETTQLHFYALPPRASLVVGDEAGVTAFVNFMEFVTRQSFVCTGQCDGKTIYQREDFIRKK